jgi:hypothetical protein
MFLYQSAYLDENQDCAGNPGQKHREFNIQNRDEMYVNMYIQPANCRFGQVDLQYCYRLGP